MKEVVQPSAETVGYLLVPRGLVFERDTYIPLDAVVKKVGRDVFVNIPKLIVGRMPWQVLPSAADHEARRGPRRSDGARLYRSRNPSASPGEGTPGSSTPA